MRTITERSSQAVAPPGRSARARIIAVVDVRMPPDYTDEGVRAAIAIRRDHPGTGVLVFSQYIETRHAAELLRAASSRGAAGIGYLLKDRVGDVGEFVDALSRVQPAAPPSTPRSSCKS